MDVEALRRPLLSWGAANRRDLPWRRTRDPWRVLVSELMLQQTQARRVGPKFDVFVARFPTTHACADAPLADVICRWNGLGYNRRAVNLHRCATEIVRRHGGEIPDDLDELLALPGIGPYTARAVLVFAFERDIGLVDTNAGRFLARAATGRPLRPREAQRVADSLVPPGHAWAWGQAVFDLGALVCTKRNPRCDECPIALHCAWHTSGHADPDPVDAGSAGIGRPQAPLAGSDREGRGRLVRALIDGPVAITDLPRACGWPDDAARATRIGEALVAEGLAEREGDRLVLPATARTAG